MSLESPRTMLDEQEVMRETSGYPIRGSEEDAWRLEPEDEMETLETKVVSNGVEGVYVDPDGEGHNEWWQATKIPGGKAKRQGKKVKKFESPKRKVLFVWNPKKHRAT